MMKNLMISFQLKKNKAKKDGTSPIYLRITLDSERTECAIQRSIKEERWDQASQRVKGRNEDSRVINNYLESLTTSAYKYYNLLSESENNFTVEQLKEHVTGQNTSKHYLFDVFDLNNQLMQKEIGSKYCSDTVKRYQISIERLKLFVNKEFKLKNISLEELNLNFIRRYDIFLRSEYSVDHNTAMKYLKHLKKVIHFAMEMGYIDRDPFMQYKTAYKEVNRGYLTADELKRIEEKKFSIKRLDQVRDVFIFVCYTGLSYSDLKELTPRSITKGIDGKNWIIYEREKTGVRASIPLLPVVLNIIEKYSKDPECVASNQLLPVKSNQKLNSYLSEIAELCEIDKHVSMHLGRHTFSTTVTLTNGVPIETVQKMLGHKNLSTTQIYAKVVDSKISEDMGKLLKRIS